jgi:hypothetical protein
MRNSEDLLSLRNPSTLSNGACGFFSSAADESSPILKFPFYQYGHKCVRKSLEFQLSSQKSNSHPANRFTGGVHLISCQHLPLQYPAHLSHSTANRNSLELLVVSRKSLHLIQVASNALIRGLRCGLLRQDLFLREGWDYISARSAPSGH